MKSKQKQDKGQLFVELYHSCKDAMYQKACGIVRNEADAQVVMKNALAHLSEVWDKLPEETIKHHSYAIISIYHAALDFYKKNKRHPELYSNIMADIVAVGQQCGVSQFDYIAAMENTDEILRRLEEINEEHCEIIMLAYYYGLSMEEAAAILGIPEKVAALRLFCAERALEKELRRLGYGTKKDTR